MEEIMKELQDFKNYVDNFKFDLIMVSEDRITLINQLKREIMEWHDSFMVHHIIEHLITSKDDLTTIFNCQNIVFSTDDYIKNITADCKQFV